MLNRMESRSALPTIDEIRKLLPPFCRQHEIARVELFGSHARGQAGVDSDIDLMVTFRPGARPGLEFFGLAGELESLLGCEVDLVTRRAVEAGSNPIRRQSILASACEVYAE
jgi:hypothetical protein